MLLQIPTTILVVILIFIIIVVIGIFLLSVLGSGLGGTFKTASDLKNHPTKLRDEADDEVKNDDEHEEGEDESAN